jgi:hypothetical protein
MMSDIFMLQRYSFFLEISKFVVPLGLKKAEGVLGVEDRTPPLDGISPFGELGSWEFHTLSGDDDF